MRRFRVPTILTLCIALLAVRIGGAHLHLCFDGNEPPVSMHLVDAGDVGEPGVPHKDANIDLSGDGPGKLPKFDLPLLALLPSIALCLFVRRRGGYASRYVAPALLWTFVRVLPPPRGPPLISVP